MLNRGAKNVFNHHSSKGRPIRLFSGQAMILAVLALGGTILGATTIAGFLMTQQIRQTTDLANSAKAIFAADAGVECALYNHFVTPVNECSLTLNFANGASHDVQCRDSTLVTSAVVPCEDPSAEVAISKGFAANARRAFLLLFDDAITSFP